MPHLRSLRKWSLISIPVYEQMGLDMINHILIDIGVRGSAWSNSSRRRLMAVASHGDSVTKLCNRCTAAACAPTPGSVPTRAVKVLLRSRGNKSPSRDSRKPRRRAHWLDISSKHRAYSSNGPGTVGQGFRGVIILPPLASYRILCPTPTNYR